MFVDVREPHTGKTLFRFDPKRDLIEIQRRQKVTVIDLSQYRMEFVEVTTMADVAAGHRVFLRRDNIELEVDAAPLDKPQEKMVD